MKNCNTEKQQITRGIQEAEWMLKAIASAIVIGRLPPDDAFAWARIAASEVEALFEGASHGAVPGSDTQNTDDADGR